MKNLFDQVGDGRGQHWSLKVFPRSFFNECLAGAHPLPVEDSQPAQPQLHDCLHLLHQVSLLHPWLFVQEEVYTPPSRCGRVLSKPGGAWWCDRCRAPPARCSVCHAVVKGLFVWCQVKYTLIAYPTYPKDQKTWACFAFGCALCKPGNSYFQGCGHGGHVLCLQQWMKEQKSCPAGCGHKCQYN